MRRVTFFLIAMAAVLTTTGRTASAKAPVRSVETIAWAIGVDHGHIPLSTRRVYAKAIRAAGIKYNFDGFTAVALIKNESRFRPGDIGDDGDAIGLGQIHYKYLCKGATACTAKRASLLNPVVNIHAMGRLIDQKRAWCRKQTGKPALFARWLFAYGYRQSRNIKCNQKRTKKGWRDLPVQTGLARIINYRLKLIKLLKARRKHRKRRKRRS